MNQLGVFEAVLDLLVRGGWVLFPIFAVGWVAWIMILSKWWFLHKQSRSFLRLRKKIEQKESQQALMQYCENAQGYFPRVVVGILRYKDRGESVFQKWYEQIRCEYVTPVHKHLGSITVLAGVSPLLGLLGTVSGMMHTFANITRFGFGNPALMADGISESLLTTQAGLIVAFPIVLAGNALSNRANRLEDAVRSNALSLMQQMEVESSGGFK